jgi:predicted transcriptional regulator
MPSNNMQTLQSTYKIEEDVKNEDLLSIVADKYCRFILEAIMDMPKSVIEIASEKKIPLSTVYRRIQTLHDTNLVQTSGTITDEGKRLFLYKSKIKGIKSKFESGKMDVELILN